MKHIVYDRLKVLLIGILLTYPTACAQAQQRETSQPSKKGGSEASRDARLQPPPDLKCPADTFRTFWEGSVSSFEREAGQTKITVLHADSGVSYSGTIKHEGDEPPLELFRLKEEPFNGDDWAKIESEKNQMKQGVGAKVWVCTDRSGKALAIQRIEWLPPDSKRPKTKSKP